VALIATAFLGSTLQARIESTEDINKDSYLKAIADRIVTSPGFPIDWGASGEVPSDFGLACSPSAGTYDLDMDKLSRLNSQNSNPLSYIEMANAAKLTNIAFAVTISQVMTINLEQTSNSIAGATTTFTFEASISINSKPADTSLHSYIIAHDYIESFNGTTTSGAGDLNVQLPTALAGDATLVVFARADFDDRITSYAVYNLADSAQEYSPRSTALSLSPINYMLHFNDSAVALQNGFVLSYSYQQPLAAIENSPCPIPKLLDKSPSILVVNSLAGGVYVQEWTSYPQIPLSAGSNFGGTERNVFSYLVTVDGVLYRLEISLGGLPH
jgi:hypothetical protein